MESIELKNTLPQVFASRDSIESDVWHKEIALQTEKIIRVLSVLTERISTILPHRSG